MSFQGHQPPLDPNYPPPSQPYMAPPMPPPTTPTAHAAPPSHEGGVGGAIAELLAPEIADDLLRALGAAIVKGEGVIGGRTEIGATTRVFSAGGTVAGIAVLGWPYIALLLRALANAWVFVPESNAEFVRFDVSERVSGRRVLPIFALSSFVALCLLAVFFAFATALGSAAVMAAGFMFAYLGMNLTAALVLRDPRTRLLVTEVGLGYGFPAKVSLLKLQCDASASRLLPQVAQLALALNGFSGWSHVSVHGKAGVTVAMK